MSSLVNSTKHLKKNYVSPPQTLPATEIVPSYFNEASITQISKPKKRYYKKRKLQDNIPDEYKYKNPPQNTIKLNSKAY